MCSLQYQLTIACSPQVKHVIFPNKFSNNCTFTICFEMGKWLFSSPAGKIAAVMKSAILPSQKKRWQRMMIIDIVFTTNCITVRNYTLKSPWFNSSHFDEEQKQNFKKLMYISFVVHLLFYIDLKWRFQTVIFITFYFITSEKVKTQYNFGKSCMMFISSLSFILNKYLFWNLFYIIKF